MVILVILAGDLGPETQYNLYKDGDTYRASWLGGEMVTLSAESFSSREVPRRVHGLDAI
jgi:hypothetical protein